MRVKQVAVRGLETISPMETVYEISRRMAVQGRDFFPVIENGELMGVVTARDLATRCVADLRDPLHTDAFDVMSRPAATIDENAEIEDAAIKMRQRNVRRLVVTDQDGRCVGVLSHNDLPNPVESEQAGPRPLPNAVDRSPVSIGGGRSEQEPEDEWI